MTFCFSARQNRSDLVDLVRLVRLSSVIELIELTEKFHFSYVRLPKQSNNNFFFGFVRLTTPAVISSYPHTAKCSKSLKSTYYLVLRDLYPLLLVYNQVYNMFVCTLYEPRKGCHLKLVRANCVTVHLLQTYCSQ